MTCKPFIDYGTFYGKQDTGLYVSHFSHTDHRMSDVICISRSTSPLLKTAVSYTIWLVWLPWQLFDYIDIAPHPNIIFITNILNQC